MRVYPVIMCGGSGTRLWPSSRPARPKQFLPLVERRSTFQQTALRAMGVGGAEALVVVAGAAHRPILEAQLAEIGLEGVLILEPAGRDSAPALAAAAAWVARRDSEAAIVALAADHHIPDAAAFVRAVDAAVDGAAGGAIVTLGLRPTHPETGFGYIRPEPGGEGLRKVEAFVEKPDEPLARRYMAEGYLWNTGMFIARAQALLDEIARFQPEIVHRVEAALGGAGPETSVAALGAEFLQAPKISIDYAVMERTQKAAVLPVDFEWSDLGSWEAVWSASPKDVHGNALAEGTEVLDAERCLVRAPAHVRIGLVGVADLAVVVEPDGVLVSHLGASQRVKALAMAGAARSPAPETIVDPARLDLAETRAWLGRWLRGAALPLWMTLGYDHAGEGFVEAIGQDGQATGAHRRARVQARQCFVYASAHSLGYPGPWLQLAERGWDAFVKRYRRPDGLFRALVDRGGEVVSDDVRLYDQAFALLALASLHQASGRADYRNQASGLLERLQGWRHEGGFREQGERPFQANAQMHLLEAALAWTEAGGGPEWTELAHSLAKLAAERFYLPNLGCLVEVFDSSWRPDAERVVEPGHQFEWAWLFHRYEALVGDSAHRPLVSALYAAGLAGRDAGRGVVVDELRDDLSVRSGAARLWPQTEWLKAACVVSAAETDTRLAAARALISYLMTPFPGLWRDRMMVDGRFADEAAPASSFYHLFCAVREIEAVA